MPLTEREETLLTIAEERFEVRLGHECGRLRAEMKALRTELRAEMQQLAAVLRADLKVEIASTKADLLKWSFLFWVGQVAVVLGLASLIR